MQWINDIIKANTDEESGKVDFEKLDAAIKTEFPKYAVPKDQYNSTSEKLKAADKTLKDLQSENKDLSELQSQIDEYKKQVDDKDKELVATRNATILKEALREAGANDIDYITFKLGDLETNEDGTYKDLDKKIEEIKKSDAKWFKDDSSEGEEDKKDKEQPVNGGYKPVDNKLKTGRTPKESEPKDLGEALKAHYDIKN